ncbi:MULTISPECIES: Wzz/FepE/Etk N-terminal domain-containing protein [unclassified Gemella]|uniref:Wzz/FepE/Etk N-terminal domain-containing protein n=1 Tax=unclassified Gemella TaxID=2624949 RepID=UPI0010747D4A|nr:MULTISPECIES: Wzz/FepE/Etk N-terminal domain-containing protein [unclassified Gemella]MBF0710760.1 capsular biosynthesis protein CpsC [Gemella sp. GL1.1]MBF0746671.1 capsular biosynthesis protein CpsC [Gemella sp. 19428wG2_WT2a]NYS28104.1 capsular biosynthesis protein CpsC [Gemella sp. GL1]TFU60021.1 capsular biosynthesis protein CpsC [Gemella sp. WT2a]
MDTKQNDILDIDIFYLLRKLWSKKLLISTIALVFAALMGVYSIFVVKPTYQATTKIYAVNKADQSKQLTVQDVQIGTSLVKDYQEIILSPDVLTRVIERDRLNLTTKSLASKISISSPKDTRVLNIIVSDSNPRIAAEIANTLREVSSEKIKSVTQIEDITTITEATEPVAPSSPNIPRNILFGFLAGAILSMIIIAIKELLDDRIKRPEDVEEVLDVVLLGVIPSVEQKKGKKK